MTVDTTRSLIPVGDGEMSLFEGTLGATRQLRMHIFFLCLGTGAWSLGPLVSLSLIE